MSVWVWIFLVPWVLLGLGAAFVAFSGGPGRARRTYLTGGRRWFTFAMVFVYLGLGAVVPGLVIASQEEAAGGTGALVTTTPDQQLEHGKQLFRENCTACHTLAAIGAKGVTGPNLDRLGSVDQQRVLNAIRNGGTGKGLMPAGILEGDNARDVAAYVAKVAGQ
jgi:mono/diheme cytochrome c family protein